MNKDKIRISFYFNFHHKQNFIKRMNIAQKDVWMEYNLTISFTFAALTWNNIQD